MIRKRRGEYGGGCDCYYQDVWVYGDDFNFFSFKLDQGLLDS